jgi:spore coat polysaccharide biosynthesis protein SpsF (cytidylyltransferase family)
VAIVQARMSSRRLPGKMMQPIGGRPLFACVMERCRMIRGVAAVVLATSVDPSDDRLAAAAASAGFTVFRGPLDDVLARYVACAERWRADVVLRVCGDSPFVDAGLADRMLKRLVAGRFDYVSVVKRRCIAGLDAEAIGLDALRRALAADPRPEDREHVTPYIRRRPRTFALDFLDLDLDPFGQRCRLTVDTAADLDFCRRVADRLTATYPGLDFNAAAVMTAVRGLQNEPQRYPTYACSAVS